MKHLFLDFDGVISPYSSILHGIIPCTSPSGCDISYFPDVIDWVNKKINDPDWKVYWLTTWCPEIEELDPVGIDKKIEIIDNTTDLILTSSPTSVSGGGCQCLLIAILESRMKKCVK